MLGINKEISDRYNLDIRSVTPIRDFFILNTSRGKKLLKKALFPEERILFIHGAKEHLFQHHFRNLDRYVCTEDGSPYMHFEGGLYTLTDTVEGRECNFNSREDVIQAAKLLASMHKASRGYVPDGGSKPQDELGKLPAYFMKRLDEIKKLKKIAKKGKSKFDYMFLDHVDYFYNLGEDAITRLSGSCYESLVAKTRQEGLFCHHDFTHHNIIFNENRAYINNFDFCCFELKVYDIANLLRRKMRKCDWSLEDAKVIVDEYRGIEPISEDDFFIMRLILQFPQKFWRVANKFYNSRRSWSEKSYVMKLEEVIEEIEPHKAFMCRYDALIEKN